MTNLTRIDRQTVINELVDGRDTRIALVAPRRSLATEILRDLANDLRSVGIGVDRIATAGRESITVRRSGVTVRVITANPASFRGWTFEQVWFVHGRPHDSLIGAAGFVTHTASHPRIAVWDQRTPEQIEGGAITGRWAGPDPFDPDVEQAEFVKRLHTYRNALTPKQREKFERVVGTIPEP